VIDYSGLRWPKPTPRVVDRIATKRQLAQQERDCRRHVTKREEGKCRACGRRPQHMHHLQRRSAGGKWTPTNVVHTCVRCHQFAHAALLHFAGNPEPGHLFTVTSQGAAADYLRSGPAWR
jgi:5-methylcytosine-specific restriction endonuclease McrA